MENNESGFDGGLQDQWGGGGSSRICEWDAVGAVCIEAYTECGPLRILPSKINIKLQVTRDTYEQTKMEGELMRYAPNRKFYDSIKC